MVNKLVVEKVPQSHGAAKAPQACDWFLFLFDHNFSILRQLCVCVCDTLITSCHLHTVWDLLLISCKIKSNINHVQCFQHQVCVLGTLIVCAGSSWYSYLVPGKSLVFKYMLISSRCEKIFFLHIHERIILLFN